MERNETEKKALAEQLKGLRLARRDMVKAAAAQAGGHNKAIRAIRSQLQDAPKTVPEIAAAAGLPSAEVLWYLATLKKYGQVLEAEQEGSYFRYRLAEGAPSEEPA